MIVEAPRGPPVSLANLVSEDMLLWVYCFACGHERDGKPAMVPLPAETPVTDIGRHMKCSARGRRNIKLSFTLAVAAIRKGRL